MSKSAADYVTPKNATEAEVEEIRAWAMGLTNDQRHGIKELYREEYRKPRQIKKKK